MPKKFQNKYRIASTRLQQWDYGWRASYFVTMCTKNRDWYFGEVINGKMKLSEIGIIANALWLGIKNHAKNVELGEFVIMPDHVHGILILNNDFKVAVNTSPALSLSQKTIGQQRFQNQGKNTLSSIVGSYKSAVTRLCNKSDLKFAWQPSFHDRIIRDEVSFQRISAYIIRNPINWKK